MQRPPSSLPDFPFARKFTATATIALALFVLATFPGCSDAFKEAPSPEGKTQSQAALSTVVKYGRPADTPTQFEFEKADSVKLAQKRLKMTKQFNEDFSRFVGAIKTAESWKEANRKARSLLEKSSPVPQYHREQSAANVMLKEWLTNGSETPAKQKATAFYTDLLVKNNSPQAATVVRSLQRLRGHWSDARIAQAARSTVQEASATLRQETADRQEKLKASMPETFRSSQEKHLYQTRDAIAQLKAMNRSAQ